VVLLFGVSLSACENTVSGIPDCVVCGEPEESCGCEVPETVCPDCKEEREDCTCGLPKCADCGEIEEKCACIKCPDCRNLENNCTCVFNGFPALHINTRNNAPVNSKEIYVPASVSFRNTRKSYTFEGVSAGVRGRGNSSWGLDKKPYRLRFDDRRPMMGADYAARSWTLIANHSDKALLRNYSAYHLSRQLDGMYFSPNSWCVDLYLNGSYRGVYLLCDQMQQNAGRAELTYDPDPAKCEYLLEWDWRSPDEGVENRDWINVNGLPIAMKYPSGAALTTAHINYLRSYLANTDNAINSQSYTQASNYIHEKSFIDYFLVQELYKNVDVNGLSLWFQIKGQGAERRVQMGPIWDFDIAAGNADYIPYGPTGLWAESDRGNSWFRRLMRIPQFKANTVARWNEIKDNQIENTIQHTGEYALEYKQYFERNFTVWPIFYTYVWPNPHEVVAIRTYTGQVDYLTGWLKTRRIWLDNYYNGR